MIILIYGKKKKRSSYKLTDFIKNDQSNINILKKILRFNTAVTYKLV